MHQANELPFSARYSLPAQVSDNLGDVSWESVVQLSTDFQVRSAEKRTKVRKIIKELQMSRLILMERVARGTREGRIDPKLLVDVVRLLQRCEEAMEEHDIDLKEFSTYLYLVSEKLKKEKMTRHEGTGISKMAPMKEDFARLRPMKRQLPQGSAAGKKK
ncbi:MAG: hypothetical protein NTX79_07460 [Candidatus Micrarchaeota archaeon]|nr:hypothetical protein [Candidatus Micrarchaeota archaeon]